MEQLHLVEQLLDKAKKDASLYYIGLFFKDKELLSKTSSRSEHLSTKFGRLIERSLELNDIIPKFKEEFLFSEGKDYSLFVYYLNESLSIGMIHLGKPNFSLLKITAHDLYTKLSGFIPLLSELYNQKYPEHVETSETGKDKDMFKDDVFASKYPEEFQPDSVAELEVVLKTEKNPSVEKSVQQDAGIPSVEEPKSLETSLQSIDVPSLEEVLKGGSEEAVRSLDSSEKAPSDVYEESPDIEEGLITDKDFNKILEMVKLEFLKAIGPFGAFLFKKKKEEFFTGNSATKFEILKFINLLSEEINTPQRKQEFIDNAKSYLLNM